MAVNAIELAEDLAARTDFSSRNASGIAHAVIRAVESTTAQLVTRDQLDARLAEVKAEIAELRSELKAEIASLRTEMHQLIRGQTIWMTSTMIGTAGVIIAAIKLLP